ncbi:hypothetical protein OIO90_001978 [Microbotryomycetes sp. JL221]|nr:hypothetical protein OIO90_001978 [Microbotryomycetes sp. JL221]
MSLTEPARTLLAQCYYCRRTTGSAFKPIVGFKTQHVEITQQSKKHVQVFQLPSEQKLPCKKSNNEEEDCIDFDSKEFNKLVQTGCNLHCKYCGSLLMSHVRQGEFVHVPLGIFVDEPTNAKPTSHIFVGSKATWYDILDNLPQFQEFPE